VPLRGAKELSEALTAAACMSSLCCVLHSSIDSQGATLGCVSLQLAGPADHGAVGGAAASCGPPKACGPTLSSEVRRLGCDQVRGNAT
jgi:hypothetical protein